MLLSVKQEMYNSRSITESDGDVEALIGRLRQDNAELADAYPGQIQHGGGDAEESGNA